MHDLIRLPAILFVVLLLFMAGATSLGAFVLRRTWPIPKENRDDFNIVQGATLTLLALLIGFTLSMAVGRYDQRKNLEEEEANAIGTEYLRAELLAADAPVIKKLLGQYLQQRILYYQTRDRDKVRELEDRTARIAGEMWRVVRDAAGAAPNPLSALVVTGMNDVINSQGYTEAAWLNRIPISAWGLMIIIAFFSSLLQGYGIRAEGTKLFLLLIVPLTVSLSLSLISDIDSPRGGLIRVVPQNLIGLQQSLEAQFSRP